MIHRSALLIPLGTCLTVLGFAWAGDLEPPGPPAPTLKTLVEVEPRKFIGNADVPLVIVQPGSYYLLENLVATGFGQSAITIATNGVSIDLNGFSISGSEVGIWDYGVTITGVRQSIAVKNGTVRDCAVVGVALDPQVFGNEATNSIVENVRAVANAGDGIRVSENSLIINSVARANGGTGFRLSGSRIEGSSAWDNGLDGIVAVNRSVVDRCTSSGNTRYGVFVAVGTVMNSTVSDNEDGIRSGTGKSAIVDNDVYTNTLAGIYVQGGSRKVRVEGNDVASNGTDGIHVDGGGNIIIRNVASDNANANYAIAAGNAVGAILDVSGADITTTNPWRNLEY